MKLMEGEHIGPFNLGNPGEFTMLELAEVCSARFSISSLGSFPCSNVIRKYCGEVAILRMTKVVWFCAQVVKEIIDPNAKIEFRPNTKDDPHMRKPDISKAKDKLGWEPQIPLRKGLPLMVDDFRKRIFGDQTESAVDMSRKESETD